MMLILLWMSFFIFYFSYLFSVFFLGLLIIYMMMVYFSSMMFLKFLIVLVYVSGVVIFILYISCMCWYIKSEMSILFLFFVVVNIYLYDSGIFVSFNMIGENLWMYLLFSMLFNSLVMAYSLSLFKVSGSLRF